VLVSIVLVSIVLVSTTLVGADYTEGGRTLRRRAERRARLGCLRWGGPRDGLTRRCGVHGSGYGVAYSNPCGTRGVPHPRPDATKNHVIKGDG
jgi:hypothetical protein